MCYGRGCVWEDSYSGECRKPANILECPPEEIPKDWPLTEQDLEDLKQLDKVNLKKLVSEFDILRNKR